METCTGPSHQRSPLMPPECLPSREPSDSKHVWGCSVMPPVMNTRMVGAVRCHDGAHDAYHEASMPTGMCPVLTVSPTRGPMRHGSWRLSPRSATRRSWCPVTQRQYFKGSSIMPITAMPPAKPPSCEVHHRDHVHYYDGRQGLLPGSPLRDGWLCQPHHCPTLDGVHEGARCWERRCLSSKAFH
jgi:hypothetical protein